MADKVKVDYSALQGESFFAISKGLLDYYSATIQQLDFDQNQVAGNAAVYGLIAHKRLLLSSISPKSGSDRNLYSLFENTQTMLQDLGIKFEQIDTSL